MKRVCKFCFTGQKSCLMSHRSQGEAGNYDCGLRATNKPMVNSRTELVFVNPLESCEKQIYSTA